MPDSNEESVLKIKVVKGEGVQPYHWQAKGPNGEIIGHGEGHPSAANAERSANTLIGYIVSGRYEVVLPQEPQVPES